MEFSCDRKELLKHVSLLARTAPAESSVPAMTGILMEADAENLELTLTATDSVSALRLRCDAAVRKAGRAVVNAQMLCACLSRSSSSLIKLSVTPSRIVIQAEQNRMELPILPAEQFPNMELLLEEDAPAQLTEKDWPALLSVPLFCTKAEAEDWSAPTGCLSLSARDGLLRGVCCDGNQLFTIQRPCEGSAAFSALLPMNPISRLSGLIHGEELTLHMTRRCVQFRKQNFLYAILRHHRDYFPVDAVIHSLSGVYSAVVETKALHTALECAAAIGASLTNLSITGNGIVLHPLSKSAAVVLPPIPAAECRPTSQSGFYYRTAKLLRGCGAFLDGETDMVQLRLTEAGVLLLEAAGRFFMLPVVQRSKRKEEASEAA